MPQSLLTFLYKKKDNVLDDTRIRVVVVTVVLILEHELCVL